MSTLSRKVCIVGLGPAGLGSLLTLANTKLSNSVLALEAGPRLTNKYCTVLRGKGCRKASPCHVIGGVGGCSVLSAGKISGYPAGSSLAAFCTPEQNAEQLINETLDSFQSEVHVREDSIKSSKHSVHEAAKHYQPFGFQYYPSYLYDHTTLIAYYRRLISAAEKAGVEIWTNATLTSIRERSPSDYSLSIRTGEGTLAVNTSTVILATGRHSLANQPDVAENLDLNRRVGHFDLGVRIEFPASAWPSLDKFHNDLKLHFGNARTFCVCKRGFLSPYRWNDILLMEGGTDLNARSQFSNLGLIVRFEESTPNEGASVLRKIEKRMHSATGGIPLAQDIQSFRSGTTRPDHSRLPRTDATIRYWREGNVLGLYPKRFADRISESVAYFIDNCPLTDDSGARIYGPEIDYFWPTITLEEGFKLPGHSVYIVGDKAGHFRGIIQAFCSGQMAADHIVNRRQEV